MDNIILSPIPLDQLVSRVTASVLEAIKLQQQQDLQEKLLTTKQLCKLFNVSANTISTWISKGLLTKNYIGGRNLFKYSEVMESMKSLKKYKTAA